MPKKILLSFVLPALLASTCRAASQPHAVAFGNWMTVPWIPGQPDNKPVALKVRALLVDGRVKEYTLGPAHEVTERLLVVRRAFRVNDSLPAESNSPPHWQWQRGGWLLVDRTTGHVSQVNLPEFDALYSVASWYRDYAAYCGLSDDGKKLYAIVAQLGHRKAVLKKPLGSQISADAAPDSACPAPGWQREPARVTFQSTGASRQTFAIGEHAVDAVNQDEKQEQARK